MSAGEARVEAVHLDSKIMAACMARSPRGRNVFCRTTGEVGLKLEAGGGEQRDSITHTYHAGWSRGLSPQADAFPTRSESSIAGAKREEKVGLLRSVPQKHPGCKKRK